MTGAPPVGDEGVVVPVLVGIVGIGVLGKLEVGRANTFRSSGSSECRLRMAMSVSSSLSDSISVLLVNAPNCLFNDRNPPLFLFPLQDPKPSSKRYSCRFVIV